MTETYFIGIDIGTTATKAIVFSSSGEMKGIGKPEYSLLVPNPGWAEQEPKIIFKTVLEAVKDAIHQAEISKEAIAAIGISAAMHSLIAVDEQGELLTNAMIWADTRSIEQTEQLKQNGIGHALYLRTGTPIHPMSPLTKLMWMRVHDSDVFDNAAKFLSIKEYFFYQLFGRYIIDYSIASATGLFNLERLQWDEEALATAGIRSEQLSEPVPTTHILRGMKQEYAEMMGVDPETPVVIGASDGCLANLGVGAIAPSQVATTIGTSGAVRTVVPKPTTDPQGRTFCYALTENHWVVGGASNSGGIVLRWFRDRFGWAEVEQANKQGVDPYEVMIQSAMTVPAGAEGLLFLPFISGERAPYWNADARGIFFGISLHHERSHFVRAVLEGILFSVYSINVVLRDLIGSAQEIRASGGFARSIQWRQIMADLFSYEVLTPEVYEGSGFGAAVLAMYAVGALDQLEDVQKLIHISDRSQPNPQLSETYQRLFEIYERVYYNVVQELSLIAEYQRHAR